MYLLQCSKLTESGLAPGVKVKTKCFSKIVEKKVSDVLSNDYDISSYCNITCTVVSTSKDGIATLKCHARNGNTTQFRWPISCLSQGFGIRRY